jgi:hypothetical protein
MSAESDIKKVAEALEAHGYDSEPAEDDRLYVVHTENNTKLTLSSFEPGVVSIEFEDGTEENVNAALPFDRLVDELGIIIL